MALAAPVSAIGLDDAPALRHSWLEGAEDPLALQHALAAHADRVAPEFYERLEFSLDDGSINAMVALTQRSPAIEKAMEANTQWIHWYGDAPRFFGRVSADQVGDLLRHPAVAFIEPDYPLTTFVSESTIDSNARSLNAAGTGVWTFDATDGAMGALHSDLPSGNLHTGSGTVVAVIDSGIDRTHKDFGGWDCEASPYQPCDSRIVASIKADQLVTTGFQVGNNFPTTEAASGHGTHVAGTIGGNAYYGRDGDDDVARYGGDGLVFGVAPEVSLVSVSNGDSQSAGFGTAALQWTLDHADELGIQVSSNSWGCLGGCSFSPSSATAQVVKDLYNAGVLVAFAAGNDGGSGSGAEYSGNAQNPYALGVAAYDDATDTVASFSSRGSASTTLDNPATWTPQGESVNGQRRPDIAAPGVDIWAARTLTGGTSSIVPRVNTNDVLGGGSSGFVPYATMSGTSMATPHVAGGAALLFDACPDATPLAVMRALMVGASSKLGGAPFEVGHGAMDVRASLDWLLGTSCTGNGTGPVDSDGDGVPDSQDVCPGHDDNVDTDNDGTPDGCDPTPNGETGAALLRIDSPQAGATVDDGPITVAGVFIADASAGSQSMQVPLASSDPGDDGLVPGIYGEALDLVVSDSDDALVIELDIGGALNVAALDAPVSWYVDLTTDHNVAGQFYRFTYANNADNLALDAAGQTAPSNFAMSTRTKGASGAENTCPVDADLSGSSLRTGDDVNDGATWTIEWRIPLAEFNHDAQPASCAAFTRDGRGLQGGDLVENIVGGTLVSGVVVTLSGAGDTVEAEDHTVSGSNGPVCDQVSEVSVTFHGTTLCSDLDTAADGSFSVTFDEELEDAIHAITATAYDAAGAVVATDSISVFHGTVVVDSDGDGIPDESDVCNGHDDNIDTDNDGTPDGCDSTPNGEETHTVTITTPTDGDNVTGPVTVAGTMGSEGSGSLEHMVWTVPDGATFDVTTHDDSLTPELLYSSSIGPGTPIGMSFEGEDYPVYICTSNFVWKDQDGNAYLGAAGHCFIEEGYRTTHGANGPGADLYDPSGVRVFACYADCAFGGLSSTVAEIFLGNYVEMGDVVYARQDPANGDINVDGDGVGWDFGIVEIPEQYHPYVDTSMPGWGGPNEVWEEDSFLLPLLLHGNAAYYGETFAQKTRIGESLGTTDGRSWDGVIPSWGGDSGSAVSILNDPNVGPEAMGLLTHGTGVGDSIVGTGAGVSLMLTSGTIVPHAIQMALDDAGLCIRPLLAGEDVGSAPAPTPQDGCEDSGPGPADIQVRIDDGAWTDATADWNAGTWTHDAGTLAPGARTIEARMIRDGVVLADDAIQVTAEAASWNGCSLDNGVTQTVTSTEGNGVLCRIVLPADRTTFDVTMAGPECEAEGVFCSGQDWDLYVRAGAAPTTDTYDCRPYQVSNNEACAFTAPAAGEWFVFVDAYQGSGSVDVTATFDFVDTDGDGVEDHLDQCPGHDDHTDVDGDGTPDGCDDLIDSDGDGVSDADDVCPGHDDRMDADADGIPDGCDPDDNDGPLGDTDHDEVPNFEDRCEGYDDRADMDGDGMPDACDADRDGDGFSNDDEIAAGTDPNDAHSFPASPEEPEGSGGNMGNGDGNGPDCAKFEGKQNSPAMCRDA